MNKKYKLLENETIILNGKTLYRIEALKDFNLVRKGDKGGFIQSEQNLSHDGNCWVYSNARVYDNARVYGNAQVYGNARVSQLMYIKYSQCKNDLSLKENLADNIRCQTGLPVLSDKKGNYVLGYKHVNKTDNPKIFISGHDQTFKYHLSRWVEAKNPDLSNASCASGLHFSNLVYWEEKGCDTVIQVKCYLDDIITVQEGKIRCKKLLPMAVVKNGHP